MEDNNDFKSKVADALDFLSCDKFTIRVSKSLDGQLPWYEKPAYWLRLLLCSTSRTFRRQMYSMDEVTNDFGCRLRKPTETEIKPLHSLSKDASERIKKALEEQSIRERL